MSTKLAQEKVLVQALVKRTSARKLDSLARARGCSRAAYLRRLVEVHVRAVTPKILRALDLAAPTRSGETT